MTDLYGNVDELLASVRRRAEQRALAHQTASAETADRLLGEARAEADAERERVTERGRAEAEEACRQCLAAADLERRERRLAAREARLERVFADAYQRLLGRYGDDGVPPDTLARLARKAAPSLPAGEVRLQLDAASLAHVDADTVARWAPNDRVWFVLDPEPLPNRHGLVARAGRASVDATLEGRLEQARSLLRRRVDDALRGAAPDPGSAA